MADNIQKFSAVFSAEIDSKNFDKEVSKLKATLTSQLGKGVADSVIESFTKVMSQRKNFYSGFNFTNLTNDITTAFMEGGEKGIVKATKAIEKMQGAINTLDWLRNFDDGKFKSKLQIFESMSEDDLFRSLNKISPYMKKYQKLASKREEFLQIQKEASDKAKNVVIHKRGTNFRSAVSMQEDLDGIVTDEVKRVVTSENLKDVNEYNKLLNEMKLLLQDLNNEHFEDNGGTLPLLEMNQGDLEKSLTYYKRISELIREIYNAGANIKDSAGSSVSSNIAISQLLSSDTGDLNKLIQRSSKIQRTILDQIAQKLGLNENYNDIIKNYFSQIGGKVERKTERKVLAVKGSTTKSKNISSENTTEANAGTWNVGKTQDISQEMELASSLRDEFVKLGDTYTSLMQRIKTETGTAVDQTQKEIDEVVSKAGDTYKTLVKRLGFKPDAISSLVGKNNEEYLSSVYNKVGTLDEVKVAKKKNIELQNRNKELEAELETLKSSSINTAATSQTKESKSDELNIDYENIKKRINEEINAALKEEHSSININVEQIKESVSKSVFEGIDMSFTQIGVHDIPVNAEKLVSDINESINAAFTASHSPISIDVESFSNKIKEAVEGGFKGNYIPNIDNKIIGNTEEKKESPSSLSESKPKSSSRKKNPSDTKPKKSETAKRYSENIKTAVERFNSANSDIRSFGYSSDKIEKMQRAIKSIESSIDKVRDENLDKLIPNSLLQKGEKLQKILDNVKNKHKSQGIYDKLSGDIDTYITNRKELEKTGFKYGTVEEQKEYQKRLKSLESGKNKIDSRRTEIPKELLNQKTEHGFDKKFAGLASFLDRLEVNERKSVINESESVLKRVPRYIKAVSGSKNEDASFITETNNMISEIQKKMDALGVSTKNASSMQELWNKTLEKGFEIAKKDSLDKLSSEMQKIESLGKTNAGFEAFKELSEDVENLRNSKFTIDKYPEILEELNKSVLRAKEFQNNKDYIIANPGRTEAVQAKYEGIKDRNPAAVKSDAFSERFSSLDEKFKEKDSLSKNEIEELHNEVNRLSGDFTAAGKTGKGFLDSIKDRFANLSVYLASFVSFYKIIDYFRQGIGFVKEYDTAMTNLKKVAEGTSNEISQFGKSSYAVANALGATNTAVIDAGTEWSRLGYNIQEASELAKSSVIYSNVGEIDAATATTDLVSALKAFNVDASDSMSVVDKLNELGRLCLLIQQCIRLKIAISVKVQKWIRPRKDLLEIFD